MAKAKKSAQHKVIKPGKDLVVSMADDFRKKLLTAVATQMDEVVVDFTRVVTVDSVGLGLVIATHNSLQRYGGKLLVNNVSKDLYNLFTTLGLHQHFTINCVDQ
ncbi:MAG: STAS domain-containing protein [Thermodesulfobacteriota bacterium]|nr:STAS domain-containing protein [Thermodesulfobacteriota bacterium]